MNKKQAERIARMRAPLPDVAVTLKKLEHLAVLTRETKARNKRAIKDAHNVLHDILWELDIWSKHPNKDVRALVSPSVLESVHRLIINRLAPELLCPTTPTITG